MHFIISIENKLVQDSNKINENKVVFVPSFPLEPQSEFFFRGVGKEYSGVPDQGPPQYGKFGFM